MKTDRLSKIDRRSVLLILSIFCDTTLPHGVKTLYSVPLFCQNVLSVFTFFNVLYMTG